MATRYPPVGFHFKVEFGVPGSLPFNNESHFKSVSGIKGSINVSSQHNGGVNEVQKQKKEKATYSPLVLERGMVANSKLVIWFQAAIGFDKIVKMPVFVTLLNENHDPHTMWVFYNAFPTGLEYSGLEATKGSVLIEKITLNYQWFTPVSLDAGIANVLNFF